MSERELIILGAGGHAAVVAETAMRAGWRVIAVASREEPMAGGPFAGARWIGDPDSEAGRAQIMASASRGAMLHAAVGDAATRQRWQCDFATAAGFVTVIDPTAVVSPSARIEVGSFIGAGAIVQARAQIAYGSIINTRAVVEHDSVLGACSHVSPGAVLCGGVRVGSGAQIGAGAVVIPGRSIGDRATIGAGAVVVRAVGADITAVGVPARARA